MPELPEVQTVVTQLSQAIEGRMIFSTCLNRLDYLRTPGVDLAHALNGRCIHRVNRHGKRIIIDLDGPANKKSRHDGTGNTHIQLILHLGMSGYISLTDPRAPLEPHTHLQIRFKDYAKELRFTDPRRFGGIWMGTAESQPRRGLATLGPDALHVSAKTLREICRRKRQLKALLMDQHVISGLGNIYCDEALFGARLHPLKLASKLSAAQVNTLAANIRAVLRKAVALGGSSLRDYRQTDGIDGTFQIRHRVYGREGKPCPRCRTPIRRIQAAGRSTHFCPKCQR